MPFRRFTENSWSSGGLRRAQAEGDHFALARDAQRKSVVEQGTQGIPELDVICVDGKPLKRLGASADFICTSLKGM